MSLMESVFGSPGIGAATNAAQGLVGQSYQNQLEQKMANHLAQQYSNALGQSMIGAQQAVAQGAYQQTTKPFNPNDCEAYKIPLSNLVTLWQAKYGDEWVRTSEEEFWHDAAYRLKEAGKFEVAKGTWYRIKEDA